MNILDKLGSGLAQSIDTIIDKNRQCAQLNRLNTVIRSETETLNRAYIALGKQYHKILEGNAEASDMSHICAVIESSKLRLKKAQARYDYIEKYGLPKKAIKEPVTKISSDENIEVNVDICDDDEDEDITIACADTFSLPQLEEAPCEEKSDEVESVVVSEAYKKIEAEDIKIEPENIPPVVVKAETASELKKKRSAGYSKKKAVDVSDSEVANDIDISPIV